MRAIDDALPDTHGVAHFNRLYLAVTEAVAHDLRADAFAAPAFLERLDVRFAWLYFDALAADRAAVRLAAALRLRGAARDPAAPVRVRRHERAHQPRPPRRAGRDVGRARPRAARGRARPRRLPARQRAAGRGREAREGRVPRRPARLRRPRARPGRRRGHDVERRPRPRRRLDERDDPLAPARRAPLAAEFLASLDRTVGLAGRGLLVPAARVPLPRWLRARRFRRIVESL